jgi:hypothetical protein
MYDFFCFEIFDFAILLKKIVQPKEISFLFYYFFYNENFIKLNISIRKLPLLNHILIFVSFIHYRILKNEKFTLN